MDLTTEINNIVRSSWENDEEYLTSAQRTLLVLNDALEQWKYAYFSDLCERYQGSCNFLSWKDTDFLGEFDLFNELDNIQFECTGCSWWYESGDDGESPSGEHWCTDCAEEQNDEEE